MKEAFVVAVDPGKHACGLAAFVDGELVHAELVGALGGQIHTLLEPVEEIEKTLRLLVDGLEMKIDTLIVELPQVYDAKQQKGDQGDLIDLAVVVGAILAVARPYVRGALLVRPATWKGQTKKEITQERVSKRLTQTEMDRVDFPRTKSLAHNVFDAIGIGIWRLER